MTTGNTALLGLALPVQGELSGTWGDVINNYITQYLDAAIAGTNTLSTDADVTLTKTSGAALTAASSQYSVLLCTGSRSVLRTITAPAASKSYTIVNITTGGFAVKIVGAGPTTGVTVANGTIAEVVWNGSDFVATSIISTAGVVPNATNAVNATNATNATTAANATQVTTTNWTVLESADVLYFKYGGVNKAKIDSSGNMTVLGNVTAYGTV